MTLLSTLLLPIGARLLSLERFWPGMAVVKAWFNFAAYAACFAGGIYLGVQMLSWYQGDVISREQADRLALAKCQSTIASSNFKNREEALQQAEQTLAERERAISAETTALEKFQSELEDARAKVPSDDAAAISADDPWLRGWQRRRR